MFRRVLNIWKAASKWKKKYYCILSPVLDVFNTSHFSLRISLACMYYYASLKDKESDARSQHMRSHPWQGHEGENLTGKADQVFRGFKKASSQDPTHDKVTRRKPDRHGGSGFQGFLKADPSAHLKDDICVSDACLNRLLPNFCDTDRRPSLIPSQIWINLEF